MVPPELEIQYVNAMLERIESEPDSEYMRSRRVDLLNDRERCVRALFYVSAANTFDLWE